MTTVLHMSYCHVMEPCTILVRSTPTDMLLNMILPCLLNEKEKEKTQSKILGLFLTYCAYLMWKIKTCAISKEFWFQLLKIFCGHVPTTMVLWIHVTNAMPDAIYFLGTCLESNDISINERSRFRYLVGLHVKFPCSCTSQRNGSWGPEWAGYGTCICRSRRCKSVNCL